MCVQCHRRSKEDLEWQMAVSCHVGARNQASTRAASALTHRVGSPALLSNSFKYRPSPKFLTHPSLQLFHPEIEVSFCQAHWPNLSSKTLCPHLSSPCLPLPAPCLLLAIMILFVRIHFHPSFSQGQWFHADRMVLHHSLKSIPGFLIVKSKILSRAYKTWETLGLVMPSGLSPTRCPLRSVH